MEAKPKLFRNRLVQSLTGLATQAAKLLLRCQIGKAPGRLVSIWFNQAAGKFEHGPMVAIKVVLQFEKTAGRSTLAGSDLNRPAFAEWRTPWQDDGDNHQQPEAEANYYACHAN